jgi:cell division protein FtsN
MANEADSGLELVLDNRKLIIVFGLLIAVCGCAFVLGFIEGKRQGFQEGNQTAAESMQKTIPETRLEQEVKPVQENLTSTSPPPNPADQPLDWYKNISRRGGAQEPPSTPPEPKGKADSTPPAPTPTSADKPKPKVTAEPALTFSVQVGAFKDKSMLDAKAQMLRQKGFKVRIEPPQTSGDFYLLKIGKYRARAEAEAMQERLKKIGISSFVKPN